MSDLIIVDITDNEETVLDGFLKQKEINGYGKILIKNPSQKSRLWNLICNLEETVNTSFISKELDIGSLNPNQEFKQEYEIKTLKAPSLKINEIFDTDNTISDKINNTFLYLQENKCTLKLILINPLNFPISNIILLREIPIMFQDLEIINPSLGEVNLKEKDGKKYIEWEILTLNGNSKAELRVNCVINPKGTASQSLGLLDVDYTINNHKLTMINPKIMGLTDSMSGIDRDEGSQPGTWDCNIEFINESDFQVKLEDVKVSHRITTGMETVVSQTPDKLLHADQSWNFNFQVEDQNVPELSSSIEFTPLYLVITRTLGKIHKESTIYPVLSATVEKTINPSEVDAYANTYMTIHNSISNNGSANIDTLTILDEMPKDFVPSELKSITIKLLESNKTLDITSRKDFTHKFEIEPEDLNPNLDHKLNIELFNLKDQFISGAKIVIDYSLLAKNPKPEVTYTTPLSTFVNSSIPGKPFISSPIEVPNIKIKYVKRKLKTLKSIKPGSNEGEFNIDVRIENKGDVELENLIIKEKIPKGFELASFIPPKGATHEIIKGDKESELNIKIPDLKANDLIKINYSCSGSGEYPRYEPEVIVQGREGEKKSNVASNDSDLSTDITNLEVTTLSQEKKSQLHEIFLKVFKRIDQTVTGKDLSDFIMEMRDKFPPGPILHQFMQLAKEIKTHEKLIVGSIRDDILSKLEHFRKKFT